MPAAESKEKPRAIGRYVLFQEVAHGGMATVHIGRLRGPAGFARTVAIKRLHPPFAKDPEFVSMFLDEARLAARIQHPNVVSVLDVVAAEGELFLVMDYIHGEALNHLFKLAGRAGVPMSRRVLTTIVVGVLGGLDAAHEAKNENGDALEIVHRDVSPHNILIGLDGVPRVLDFGVAKAALRVHWSSQTGQIKGKLGYMSPEQLTTGLVDRRADIYSAGVILWEGLTGRRLFDPKTAPDVGVIVSRILTGEIDPPSKLVPSTPKMLDAIVLKALARSRDDRYATAREMAVDLERAQAPLPSRQVGDWVAQVAGAGLKTRAAMLSEIEQVELPKTTATISDFPAMRPIGRAEAEESGSVSVPPIAVYEPAEKPVPPEPVPAPPVEKPAPAVAEPKAASPVETKAKTPLPTRAEKPALPSPPAIPKRVPPPRPVAPVKADGGVKEKVEPAAGVAPPPFPEEAITKKKAPAVDVLSAERSEARIKGVPTAIGLAPYVEPPPAPKPAEVTPPVIGSTFDNSPPPEKAPDAGDGKATVLGIPVPVPTAAIAEASTSDPTPPTVPTLVSRPGDVDPGTRAEVAMEPSSPAGDAPPLAPRRLVWISGVAVAALAVVTIWVAGSRTQGGEATGAASSPMASSTSTATATATSISTATGTATATEAPTPSAASTPAPADSAAAVIPQPDPSTSAPAPGPAVAPTTPPAVAPAAAPTTPAPPHVRAPSKAPPKINCNPPFTTDSQGIRIPKRECFR